MSVNRRDFMQGVQQLHECFGDFQLHDSDGCLRTAEWLGADGAALCCWSQDDYIIYREVFTGHAPISELAGFIADHDEVDGVWIDGRRYGFVGAGVEWMPLDFSARIQFNVHLVEA